MCSLEKNNAEVKAVSVVHYLFSPSVFPREKNSAEVCNLLDVKAVLECDGIKKLGKTLSKEDFKCISHLSPI